MLELLVNNFLVAEDIFVIDNVVVHCGTDILEFITGILELNEVILCFLSIYSPEFNLCELTFSKKHYIQHNHVNDKRL